MLVATLLPPRQRHKTSTFTHLIRSLTGLGTCWRDVTRTTTNSSVLDNTTVISMRRTRVHSRYILNTFEVHFLHSRYILYIPGILYILWIQGTFYKFRLKYSRFQLVNKGNVRLTSCKMKISFYVIFSLHKILLSAGRLLQASAQLVPALPC